MGSLDFLTFFFASLITLALVYFKVSTTILQQTIAFLLVILILFSKRFLLAARVSNKLYRLIFLSLSSLFVQLLVISSGGLYSPFLILVHLFTLGISFLLNITAALSFLIFTLMVLTGSTFLNKTMLSLFQQDPWSAILYFISFLVIIPLAQFLMRTYHLQDTISRILAEQVKLGERREESILQGLSELVFVTDENLKIISANEASERILQVTDEEMRGEYLLDLLHLIDENNTSASLQFLSIDKALADKATHMIEGLRLDTKEGLPIKVKIQVRPITAYQGAINQIAFIITDARFASGRQGHSDLQPAILQHQVMMEQLKRELKSAHLPKLSFQAELSSKTEEDILLAQELEDHPITKVVNFQDIAVLCWQAVFKKQPLAQALGVNLQFVLPKEEAKEAALLGLRQTITPENLPISDFAVPVDAKWVEIMVQKLIDLAILIAYGVKNSQAQVLVNRQSPNTIDVLISATPTKITEKVKSAIFQKYFGDLKAPNLGLGSGLEGFIAKQIALQLNIPLEAKMSDETFTFQLSFTKSPH